MHRSEFNLSMASVVTSCTVLLLRVTGFVAVMLVTMFSTLSHGKSNGGEELTENIVLRKGQWTSEEDAILSAYVTKHGVRNWNEVQKHTRLARCGKSCRLRWSNHLRPGLRKCPFNKDEQRKIIELHALMGNKWSRMAKELPGRTDNEIKNFWNTRTKKRRRAGLPLYPDDIKPLLNTDKQENNLNASADYQANDSQADSFSVPELLFDSYNLSQKHPIYLSSSSDITDMTTLGQQDSDHKKLPSNLLHNCLSTCKDNAALALINQSSDYASSSSLPCILELPWFPSFDDTPREDSQDEQTQFYKPVSPCSNGLLESIFYTPEVLEDLDNCCMLPCETQMDSNSSANKDNSNQRNVTLSNPSTLPDFNPSTLPDFNWLENYDKDPYSWKDTLFPIIQPYLKKDI